MDARRIARSAPSAWTTESLFETGIESLVNAPRPPAFVF